MANTNMNKAKALKNDKFYTQYKDIEKELNHYTNHLKNKIVYCNCDNYEWSNFYKYFLNNFRQLELKKLIATHYSNDNNSYKMIIELDNDNNLIYTKTKLIENGNFRSDECIEILKEADIVITNPPFSLFREYIALLEEYNKKYLIIGSMNAITYKNTFKLIKENKLWLGRNYVKEFIQPNGLIKKFGNINWYTNLEYSKRNEKLLLWKKYNEIDYPKYDNYDAINVDKVDEIPIDYSGCIGVPITFIHKYNPNQFELLGIMNTAEKNEGIRYEETIHGRPIINGVEKYLRIIIKRKETKNEN